ncbi:aldehyde dehydrogenase family protein [Streptantibioticus cattleyicolor]|uniref:Putative oxidoreductase n=2 Tax=Streptantibioticus cattleyicolor TaxID=29303 RepID=F8JNE3_STREN|nr:aldehyde dehydrogenase family protein [Streptantibioticus cattleyicolor]AEW99094.1 putative oxidoreductase [Streptantibioticus cattleyicolor NRRL 8057 = DSM 46488]CAD18983.1 putative oxidoreductase [Streptantibioticus cattleyicolor]CCB71860.1 putative oxidoreductase [Streptantibioticus cattleyicolor NRRL 8057 = DSM 46488]
MTTVTTGHAGPQRAGAVLDVPAYAGRRPVMSSRPAALTGTTGETVARVGAAGRLVQFQMAQEAAAVARRLRATDDDAWFALLRRAADTLTARVADGTAQPWLTALSAASGLPPRRAARGIETVAADLARMDEILAAQSPDGTVAAYRTGGHHPRWSWRPAGRSVLVKVADNFPTINIEWLQALAARRPVLLSTSRHDPFTPVLLTEALYEAGLPEHAVSVVHGDAPALRRLADQVLWPGEDVPADLPPGKAKTYHFGRSRAVVGAGAADDAWPRLARAAFAGCGRLCTNVSSVIALGDARQAADRLAEEFATRPVLPLDDPAATVPAFPDRARRDALATRIEREIAAGAVDVTEAVTGVPLRVEVDGAAFLRPTVLLVDPGSPLFGTELPFPFTAVAHVPRSKAVAACAGSLIVSVLGDAAGLLGALAEEPGVDKVFGAEEYDRGYHPCDPHEGYLADFLFRKKAVIPGAAG